MHKLLPPSFVHQQPSATVSSFLAVVEWNTWRTHDTNKVANKSTECSLVIIGRAIDHKSNMCECMNINHTVESEVDRNH